jgi:hypothetical protein
MHGLALYTGKLKSGEWNVMYSRLYVIARYRVSVLNGSGEKHLERE